MLLYLFNDVPDISKIESDKLEIMDNIYEFSSFIHDCYKLLLSIIVKDTGIGIHEENVWKCFR